MNEYILDSIIEEVHWIINREREYGRVWNIIKS